MIFTSSLCEPEGPVRLSDGSWLVVEMGANRGCVTHISPDGEHKRVVARTGAPNGLAVDKHGTIWVAESGTPSLLTLTMDGRVEQFLNVCGDKPFLYPNDLVFGPDGDLYMTDSGILRHEFEPEGKLRPDYRECPMDGRVYQINVRSRAIREIDCGLRFPNGLAFGPDNDLYVNETITGNVYRYRWQDGIIDGERQVFGNVADENNPSEYKFPDGQKFGADGKLYVAVYGQGDITVLGRDGRVERRFKTEGRMPTNLAFGPAGSRQIYVTECEFGRMEILDVETDGVALFRGH